MHQKTLKNILRKSVQTFPEVCSQQVMRTLEGPTSLPWTLTPVIVHPLAQKPYTLPLKHYDWGTARD